MNQLLQAAVDEYFEPGMEDPEWAEDSCRVVSEAFLYTLRRHGLTGQLLGLRRGQTYHQVVLVDDTVVDWTLHQFDPEASVPTVLELENYLEKGGWVRDAA